MTGLTGAERRHLRSLAHPLKPVVQVGKQGIVPKLIETVSQGLDAHELIKVRFVGSKELKKELSAEIARRSDSYEVGLIGNVSILYRQNPNPEKRKVHMPRRPQTA